MTDVPGWTFQVTEESSSYYCARGCGPGGMTVEGHNSNPDEALSQAAIDAAELNARIGL